MSLLTDLVLATGLSGPDLMRIIISAPRRYKVYPIKKKDGGERIIAHPSRELKLLQRVILDKYLIKFPVHSAAMAYTRGRNIYENAIRHSQSRYILKLDFESFFPSIKANDWRKFIESDKSKIFENQDEFFLTPILFWGGIAKSSTPQCLSIGAPTSPIISNILLFDLDTRITDIARGLGIAYSRYADDITLSAASLESVLEFEKLVRREVGRTRSPRLKFNEGKRGLYGRGQRRMVTGLVVTPGGDVSIGRERKRTISSMLHRFSYDELDVNQIGVLKGLLGFAIANEAGFVNRMRDKYGDTLVDKVLKTQILSRKEREASLVAQIFD